MTFMLPIGIDARPVAVAGVRRGARTDAVPTRSGVVHRHG